jgi:hypothetical protein
MKKNKLLGFLCFCAFLLSSCSKADEIDESQNQNLTLQSTSNSTELVRQGEVNCVDAITSNIKIKATAQAAGSLANVQLGSKTEKLYPSGGYILVYELTRTPSLIVVDYKKVHTSCGNPSASALLPATSAPTINGLTAGNHNIEVRINGQVNKGSLMVHPSLTSVSLQMQTTNGIVIE